jgi:DNA-binding response OmpR family regulator/anti-sigma regulatory factor (Ser/Thr protein kinase)
MSEQGEKKTARESKTILVVDDEPKMRRILRLILESEGYHVKEAEDGQAAWEIYKSVKPDLVVTDSRMPRSDGFELLNRIMERDALTPVILITGFATTDNAICAIKSGAADYITKPFELEQLLSVVDKCLDPTRAELEIYRYKKLAQALDEKNSRLRDEIEQLSKEQDGGRASSEVDKLRAICRAVAHNLKGEFLHIGGAVKNLRELVDNSSETQEECEMIERSIKYSQILLRRLLDQLELGRIQTELIDPVKLCHETELLVRPRLPSNIKFQSTVSRGIRGKLVTGNTEQLVGVLLELINNAINVSRQKGGAIELNVKRRGGEMLITVSDNGPGIPAEIRKHLFREQVASKSGLGLGLVLCEKVIAVLGGKLSLQSTSQEGSTFKIRLPIASDKKES